MIEMKIKIKYSYKVLLLFLGVAFIAFGFLGDDKNGVRSPKPMYKITSTQASGKQGDAYGLNINNVWMPLNRRGIIADVNVPPNGSLGQYAGGGFLFSSGFFLSGYSNGTLWANAAASASLVEDYVQGVVDGESDPNAVIYVINSQDEPFGQSWQDWIDAVNLGADFVDGDGDGAYNPVDKNGNGAYDPDEDMPDLIGDELAWCVFHDGLPVAQRRWNTTIEVGMEVRQSVFAFASAGAIGNIIFVRYRIKYVGTGTNDPEELTDVYFGAWADTDLGDATDDVIGVDVPRNAGYTYGNGPDAQYGVQVPCFMIDFFSGPRAYIAGDTYVDNNGDGEYDEGDTPLDTAHSVRGQLKGVAEFPGAKNLPISSFVMYINGDPDLNDPENIEEARNYSLGGNRVGVQPDPCIFPFGEVRGPVLCDTVDARFWFSGDPVRDVGWICNQNRDTRQMTNTGPFILKKDVENEIVLAYVVGRGANPLDGITKTRPIDDGAQNIFDLNFLAPTPPPPPIVTLTSSDDFIDISWDTPRQLPFVSQTPTWDLRFEGYQVYAFKTNVPEDIISGEENSVLLARYDLQNFIQNVYKENGETGGIELLYEFSPPENQLDSALYVDPETGRIRIRVFNDPFSPNEKIVKGRPYYFAVTSYALNFDALVFKDDPTVAIGDTGDYYLDAFAFAQEAENIRSIVSIVVGEDNNNPPVPVQSANRVSGASTGNVGYDIIDIGALTNNQYELTFFKDSASTLYSMYWRLFNTSTNTLLIDSSKSYIYGEETVTAQVVDGFLPRVEDITATLGTPEYLPASSIWFTDFDLSSDGTGVLYVGEDIPENGINIGKPPLFSGQKSNKIFANDLRRVELRFGQQGVGKAYRYINGYIGGVFSAKLGYAFASAITANDTVNRGPIDNWDVQNNRPNGFVDVPFTAWLVDPNFSNEEIQLAVGFLERRRYDEFTNGTPDGVWDPTDNVIASGEYIFIFNSPYDPNGGQMEYTGGAWNTPQGPEVVWSDLLKSNAIFAKKIPDDAIGVTQEQRDIFDSPYFNTMYTVGFQRINSSSFFSDGDKLIMPISEYPYTEGDVYQFTTSTNTISEDQRRELWEKVNVYPNPLFGYNTLSNYYSNTPDEPFVTFTNLPEDVTIKIYSLSGTLLRTLTTDDKDSPSSPFLRWDLENESTLRVASGMYLAIVSNPEYGDKVLKFAIIMPQKQIQRF
jgi:hypothetical protein